MFMNSKGYVCKTKGGTKEVFMIKYANVSNPNAHSGMIEMHNIRFPPYMVGKRVRIKIELVR